MNKKLLTWCLILTACGADTYEECVLDNIDDAKTPYAARLVTESCRAKFPNHFDKYTPVTKININDAQNHFDAIKIEEIEPSEYNGSSNLEVTNYSPWQFKALSIGIVSNPVNNSCPKNMVQYSRFIKCTNGGQIVDKNTTTQLNCDDSIGGEAYCLVTIHFE